MSNVETTTIDKIDFDFTTPSKYKVIILNDDQTPIEFVIGVLMELFNHSYESAEKITLEIHTKGRGIAGIYYYEIAEQKMFEAVSVSRANGFPLKVVIEES